MPDPFTSEPANGEAPGDAGSSGTPVVGRELMPDPSFEEGHEGWYGFGNSRIVDVLEPHSGSRAILSTNRAATWEGPAYDIRSLVDATQAYSVSVWVRNELDTQMVMLTLKSVCDSEITYTRLATRPVAVDWLQLTSGFFVPECATGLQELAVYVEGPPAFKNLLVDDVSLQTVELSGQAQEASDAGAPSESAAAGSSSSSSASCNGNVSGHASSNGNASTNASCNGNTSG